MSSSPSCASSSCVSSPSCATFRNPSGWSNAFAAATREDALRPPRRGRTPGTSSTLPSGLRRTPLAPSASILRLRSSADSPVAVRGRREARDRPRTSEAQGCRTERARNGGSPRTERRGRGRTLSNTRRRGLLSRRVRLAAPREAAPPRYHDRARGRGAGHPPLRA